MRKLRHSVPIGIFILLLLLFANPDVSVGQMHCWPFDEIDGSAVYDYVGTNDGTVHGNVTSTDGIIGKALDFDGAGNSYVAFLQH